MQVRTIAVGHSPHRVTRNGLILAGVILVGLGLGVGSVRTSPNLATTTGELSCSARLIIVDTSSETRGPELVSVADQVLREAAISAIVCDQPVAEYAVAGGGLDSPVLTSEDLAGFTPAGPSPQIRASRLTSAARAAVGKLINVRLRSVYNQGDPSVTSVDALYELAAEQSTQQTQIIIISTGVNDDIQVNLNVPLAAGQGAWLARSIAVPRVAASYITVVGIAQVDASIPPPSPIWSSQIIAFNAELCRASGVARCRIFEIAPVSQILNP